MLRPIASRPTTRRLATCLVIAASLSLPRLAWATTPAQQPGRSARVSVEVELGESDDAVLAQRIDAEARRALQAKDVTIAADSNAAIAIAVAWNAQDDHEIAVTVTHDGATTSPDGSPFVCKGCGENELLAKVAEVMPSAAVLLPGPTPAATDDGTTAQDDGTPPPAEDDGTVTTDDAGDDGPPGDEPRIKPMTWIGGVGIVLAAGGIGLTSAGAADLVKGERRSIDPGAPDERTTEDARPRGIALVAAGATVLVAGIVLLSVDLARQAKRRRTAFAPVVGPHWTGATVVVNF